jgi:predicted nucleic acid-binding protein
MSGHPSEFLDTSILVYTFSVDPKSAIAEAMLARGCVVGLQGLNEFASVARRNLKMTSRGDSRPLPPRRAARPP